MNVEGVKRSSPSLPLDVHWGHFAYCNYLDRHPNCRVRAGDNLIFVFGHFPRELTAIPLGISFPDPGSHVLRIDVYNQKNKSDPVE